jgi:hypothetical protein
MSATQLDLLSDKAPKISEGEIDLTLATLRDWRKIAPNNNGWLKSEQLGAKTWNEKRHLRAIAQAAGGRIVSWPGSPGYKLFDECTPKEFLRFDSATSSAMRELGFKRAAVLQRMHSRGIVFPSIAEGAN